MDWGHWFTNFGTLVFIVNHNCLQFLDTGTRKPTFCIEVVVIIHWIINSFYVVIWDHLDSTQYPFGAADVLLAVLIWKKFQKQTNSYHLRLLVIKGTSELFQSYTNISPAFHSLDSNTENVTIKSGHYTIMCDGKPPVFPANWLSHDDVGYRQYTHCHIT